MFVRMIAATWRGFNRFMEYFMPLGDLIVRLWVAEIFFRSGLIKISNFDSTLFLFESEYKVPLVSSHVAAYLGTGAELVLPVCLALGLFGRLPALGLFFFNIVAVISYPFLFTEQGQTGFQHHIYWGLFFLMLMFHGNGALSLDTLISKWYHRQEKQNVS